MGFQCRHWEKRVRVDGGTQAKMGGVFLFYWLKKSKVIIL